MEPSEINQETLTAAQKDIYKMFSIKLSEDEWRQVGDILSGYIVSKRIDPEILAQSHTRLNEQQLQMLNLLKRPMPEDDYEEIKRKILFLKAKAIDAALAEWENENGITAEDYDKWSKEHFRVSEKHVEGANENTSKYFAQKATAEMDKLFEENGWGEEKIAEWANAHLRIPYNK